MDDDTDSQSLLQSVLRLFARKRLQRPAKPASLRSRKREAWLQTDAFLQRDNIGETDPVSVARTLRAFEYFVQDDSDGKRDFFFELQQGGELPNITKPFLTLEHVPIILARSTDTGNSSSATKHIVYPNASVLALGILLCELHYCTPVELMAKDPHVARKINNNFYTCLDKLQTLEDDAGVDYYLATKVCLTGEYYPLGQHADFEDVSVQRLFYQNVIKRLEAVIFKA
ncbi:uncharacterized protein KD926_000773 [Aspergillus affinis]|uniref:uncharacterized protein n=1 Tax=Aspergillus affinis TaxID=1070780 RepID=UPI0022FEC3A9|nr:uncharacterized protein KD926_000773 [Aspergillus affinis]KAI9037199.1 hypothetical protein KD926_000773 [Aspergillus affinis]